MDKERTAASPLKQISRYGAYGALLKNDRWLLTLKKSGPYKGLWDLPGGGIEFGETPEEALKREFLEETALAISQIELWRVVTSFGEYDHQGERIKFHHVGILYKVFDFALLPDAVSEEEGRWALLSSIKEEELTPFARDVLNSL